MATFDEFYRGGYDFSQADIPNPLGSGYTTTNSYVVLGTYNVVGLDTVIISPWVTSANAADFQVEVTTEYVDSDTDPDNLDFIVDQTVTSISSSSNKVSSQITYLRPDGVTAIRISAKSSVTDTAAVLLATVKKYL